MKLKMSVDNLDNQNAAGSPERLRNPKLSTIPNLHNSEKANKKLFSGRLKIIEEFLKKKISLIFYSKSKYIIPEVKRGSDYVLNG